MSEENLYGYHSDEAEDLGTKEVAQFGGNFGNCYLTGFEYKDQSKEDEEERMALEVTVKRGDRDYKLWFGEITQSYHKGNKVHPGDEGFKEAAKKDAKQANATIIHILKALGVSDEQLKNALGKGFSSFDGFVKALLPLVPTGYEEKPLDVFFEYEFSLGTNKDGEQNDKTYPRLPKNMKGGYFIVPAQPGTWEEKRTDEGGLYYENENGQAHPFRRSPNFMESNKAVQQFKEGTASPQGSQMQQGASGQEEAKWG